MIALEDRQKLEALGYSTELIEKYLKLIKEGVKPLEGLEVATLNNGIIQLSKNQQQETIRHFKKHHTSKKWAKFIPASGMASRMFSFLYEYKKAAENIAFDMETYLNKTENENFCRFVNNIESFPFFDIINDYLTKNKPSVLDSKTAYIAAFIDVLLSTIGQYPKGLIPFFRDGNGNTYTPFQAQLIESIGAFSKGASINVHFTVDKAHQDLFKSHEKFFRMRLPEGVNKLLHIDYSVQNPLTNMPALDENYNWLRNDLGELLFRKGGHGALLSNLDLLDVDIVCLKNIDNILTHKANAENLRWQQILNGFLLIVQNELFAHLKNMEKLGERANFKEIINFIQTHFNPEFNIEPQSAKQSFRILKDYLNRPLRVCAMVRKEGATGGVPFWIKGKDGKTLQIVENVELNKFFKEHKTLLSKATHFNPVLMVCGVTNYQKKKFCLMNFNDSERFMVISKMMEAKKIRTLEWPGLWNGGMAHWNSIFVEVPNTTFRPIKALNDLLST